MVTESRYQSLGAGSKAHARAVMVTALMALAYMVNIMNQGIVLVVAEQIKVDFALSNAQLGFVLGMSYMLFSAVGAVPLGRLADLQSRSLVVGLSLTLMGVASAVTSVVHAYWSLITMRAAAGTGDAGVLPGAVSMISDHVSVARRPFAISIFNAGASIGALLVYLLMGFVAQRHGWRTAYLWVGVLGIAVGLLISVALQDQPRSLFRQTGDIGSVRTTLRLFRIRAYGHIVVAFIAFGMTSSATWHWLSPLMQRTYGLSVAQAGTLLGVGAGMATVLGSLFFGVLASRLRVHGIASPVRAAAVMQLCSAVCFVSGLCTDLVPWTASLIVGGYFFAGSGMVVVLSTIQEVVPSDSRGLAFGLAALLFSLLGQGIGPVVTGTATDQLTSQLGGGALRLVMQLAMVAGTAWIVLHLMFVARSLKETRSV